MDVRPETLIAYLAEHLDSEQRLVVEQALSASDDLRRQLSRLRVAVATVRDDATWSVPSPAVGSAKALGRRLDSLRAPSMSERLAAAVSTIVARLTFDSRAEGALAGLRGETGFAVVFKADDVDIELECDVGPDDRHHVVGQLTSSSTRRFMRAQAWRSNDDPDSGEPLVSETVGPTGMFRLTLAAGRYRLRFEPADSRDVAIDVPAIDIP